VQATGARGPDVAYRPREGLDAIFFDPSQDDHILGVAQPLERLHPGLIAGITLGQSDVP
jgi:hypothetical protein